MKNAFRVSRGRAEAMHSNSRLRVSAVVPSIVDATILARSVRSFFAEST